MQVIRANISNHETLAPLFDAYRKFYGQKSDVTGARAFVAARLASEESVIFLARQADGTGLGFTQLYPLFSSIHMSRLWLLNDLYVIPEVRRHGVAKALMGEACRHAMNSGAKGLILETARANRAAKKLYKKLGWQEKKGFVTFGLDL